MKIKEVAAEILEAEGLYDWKIDWWIEGAPPECWPDIKLIVIPDTFKRKTFHYQLETILHEIAHAKTGIEHDSNWANAYGELLIRYCSFFKTQIDKEK